MATSSGRWQGIRRYGAPRVVFDDENRDADDSVLAERQRLSSPSAARFHAACHDQESGPVRNFLDAFSCLCIGTEPNDANPNTGNNLLSSSSTLSSMDSPVTEPSPGNAAAKHFPKSHYYRASPTPEHIVFPIAYLGDPVGAYVERPTQQRSSSLPSHFFFRPVSEDNENESCVGGDNAKYQPWEA
jgi:hypothetical protein